jgi:uncharacterized protein YbjQ (UPF0145 family)
MPALSPTPTGTGSWFIEPLRALWPLIFDLPLPIRIGLIIAGIGLLVVMATVIQDLRAKHIGKDILAVLRNLVGGELNEYTDMLTEARNEAINRMIEQAKALDADAVVGLRLVTAQVATASAEILAYGTAVKLEDRD